MLRSHLVSPSRSGLMTWELRMATGLLEETLGCHKGGYLSRVERELHVRRLWGWSKEPQTVSHPLRSTGLLTSAPSAPHHEKGHAFCSLWAQGNEISQEETRHPLPEQSSCSARLSNTSQSIGVCGEGPGDRHWNLLASLSLFLLIIGNYVS